jgi:RimJ/RimL family protein N-acetyltransferase
MTVDWQPTLVGELIELRPLEPDDWDALFAVASDPLIWEQHPDRLRYQEDVFREFFRVALETQSAFVAIDRRDGRIIGSSRYFGHDPIAREVEIGWSFLARSHWGGRYNGEMKALMLAHAFQFVDHVIFVIGPDNIRSQRAVQKLGAVLGDNRDVRGADRVVYRLSKVQADSVKT